MSAVARVLLLGPARQAAGESTTVVEASCVDDVLAELRVRYGEEFARILATSKVWVDGQPAAGSDPVTATAEVAVLPPVSGG